MENKKCVICGGLALTYNEVCRYKGVDDVSIFCTISKNRVCVICASKINQLMNPPSIASAMRSKASIPPKIRWGVFERDGYKCKKCGSKISLHCDHIHPESKGGATVIENLQTLCETCNKSKGNR